jgi:Domain of unknown function (DUF1877)
MGMESVLVQATPAQLQEFSENTRLLYQYVTGDPGGDDNVARIQAMTRASLNRMRIPEDVREKVEQELRAMGYGGAKAGPQLVKPMEPQPEKKEFSLNKDWHVLHYALNGTAEGGDGPLAFAVFGDKEFPDPGNVDYGPARYLTPQQVKEVYAELQQIKPASLLSKLDYKDAKEKRIYLDHTLTNLEDWSYLPEFFEEFRDFYADAAECGNGMIMKII